MTIIDSFKRAFRNFVIVSTAIILFLAIRGTGGTNSEPARVAVAVVEEKPVAETVVSYPEIPSDEITPEAKALIDSF